ncbi:response regulator [Clostridia bacterium OttesenSCG-928-O13]|nr:response regulator [Clostridia bacterium OttesenSCG-928-O13]
MVIAILLQLCVTVLAGALLGFAIYKRNIPRSHNYTYLAFVCFIYCLSYYIKLTATDLPVALLGDMLQRACIPLIAVLYYFYAREYHNRSFRRFPFIALILAYPLFNVLLLLLSIPFSTLSPYENLVFIAEPIPQILCDRTPLFIINMVYSVIFIIMGFGVTVRNLMDSSIADRKESIVFYLASFLPAFAFTYRALGLSWGGFDISPLCLLSGLGIIGYHVIKVRLGSWMQLARDMVLENINDGFVVLDTSNHFIDANAMALSYFPELNQISKGTSITDVPHFPVHLLSSDKTTCEFSINTGGKMRHLRASHSAIHFQGNAVGTCIMIYDITAISELIFEIENLMQAVRVGYLSQRADPSAFSSEYTQILQGVNNTLDLVTRYFDAVPQAIAFLSPEGQARSYNKSMEYFFTMHYFDAGSSFLAQALLNNPTASLRELTKETGTYSTGISLLDRTETVRNYTLSILPVQGSAETFGTDDLCYILLLNDTTVLTRAKNEAEKASQAKGDFLSRMSHEIRTPMNAITGMTQIAISARDTDKMRECLYKIEDSSEHLLGIINDILDFSKIESGKLTLDRALFSLRRDISFVEDMLRPRTAEKKLNFNVVIENITHDGIWSDSLRLNQVLINLLSNAIKFTGEGGQIDLIVNQESFRDGHGIYRFTVKDTGIGIDPTHAKKLFTPFEQADNSVSRKYGGTGLGLAISKSIVELMGGTIILKSVPGNGSTFTFTVHTKAQEAAVENLADGTQAHQPLQAMVFPHKRALIVDDIEINREILVELLGDTQIDIDTAENGLDALEKYTNHPAGYYNIILMDMQMPVMDGCTATSRIRASGRGDCNDIKIVAMTANVMREDIQKAFDSGMNGHLAKPISMDDVYKTLSEMLA